jgi:hypothetical protein
VICDASFYFTLPGPIAGPASNRENFGAAMSDCRMQISDCELPDIASVV